MRFYENLNKLSIILVASLMLLGSFKPSNSNADISNAAKTAAIWHATATQRTAQTGQATQ